MKGRVLLGRVSPAGAERAPGHGGGRPPAAVPDAWKWLRFKSSSELVRVAFEYLLKKQ